MSIQSLFFRLTPCAYSSKKHLLATMIDVSKEKERLKIIWGYCFLFTPHQHGSYQKNKGKSRNMLLIMFKKYKKKDLKIHMVLGEIYYRLISELLYLLKAQSFKHFLLF